MMTRFTLFITMIVLATTAISARTVRGEVRSDNDSTVIAGEAYAVFYQKID